MLGDLIHENQLIASLLNGMEEENERNSIEAIFYVLGEIVKVSGGPAGQGVGHTCECVLSQPEPSDADLMKLIPWSKYSL